jgi:hypothetical protein
MSQRGRVYIGNWSNPNDIVEWQFELPAAGSYTVELDARRSSEEAVGQRVEVRVGDQSVTGRIEREVVRMDGRMQIPAGSQTISVTLPDAKRTAAPVVDLFGVKLVPAER